MGDTGSGVCGLKVEEIAWWCRTRHLPTDFHRRCADFRGQGIDCLGTWFYFDGGSPTGEYRVLRSRIIIGKVDDARYSLLCLSKWVVLATSCASSTQCLSVPLLAGYLGVEWLVMSSQAKPSQGSVGLGYYLW